MTNPRLILMDEPSEGLGRSWLSNWSALFGSWLAITRLLSCW